MGETEVKVGCDLNGFMAGTVTYSPVKHLLVTATGASSWRNPATGTVSQQALQRHGQAGIGLYVPVGANHTFTVIGAAGQTRSFSNDYQTDFGFVRPLGDSYLTHVRSQQQSAQASWQYSVPIPKVLCTLGLAYRATFLQYTRYAIISERFSQQGTLLDRQEVRYDLPNMVRQDLWSQVSIGPARFSFLQLQLGIGTSSASASRSPDNATDGLLTVIKTESQGEFLGQAALVFYPHLLRKPGHK